MNVINTSKLQVLVVDIRNNSGGNSALGDLLLTHLTKKKFSLMGKRYWRVSDLYKAYLLSQGNTSHEYLKKQDGTLWERGNCKPSKSPFRVKEVYEGKVYFITGPFTFSSANMIADGVKQYKLATILGEPTGENTNDFGEVYSFELPWSKIRFNTTTSYDIGADCNDKKMSPVIPNVHIPLTTADKLEGRDPVMDYILKKH